jgi:hypothetical protein
VGVASGVGKWGGVRILERDGRIRQSGVLTKTWTAASVDSKNRSGLHADGVAGLLLARRMSFQ